MNFSEFKKLLGAEPRNRDPETLAAQELGPEFVQAAAEAEEFEQKLEDAVLFDVDSENLLPDILSVSSSPPQKATRWMAMAAGLVVAVGVATIAVYQANQPKTIEEYVSTHFQYDGSRVLASASEEFDPDKVNRIMARFEAEVGPDLVGKVNFIKVCPTLHGKGAHMVVSSTRGEVTVIYMPDTEVDEGRLVLFDDMQARVVALASGSAAIIGKVGQDADDVESLLRSAITPMGADA